jgi:hypothetical protein
VNYVANYLIEIFNDESNLDWLITLGEPLMEVFIDTWEELSAKTLNLLKAKSNEEVVQSLVAKTKEKSLIPTKVLTEC